MELLYRFTENGDKCICTGIVPKDYAGKVVIPEKVNGIPVCGIGKEAFQKCDLSSIHIPDCVTFIDFGAFFDCPNLSEVTFGECSQLVEVGNSAFEYGDSCLRIRFPETMRKIGYWAFANRSVDLEIHIDCETEYSTFEMARGKVSRYGQTDLGPIEEDENRHQYRLNKERNGYVFTKLGRYDFEHERVTVPSSFKGIPVVELGCKVFCNCEAWHFHIPVSVVKSHDQPFYGCDELMGVSYEGTIEAWKRMNIYCWEDVICSDGVIEGQG